MSDVNKPDDSTELEALFDSIAANVSPPSVQAKPAELQKNSLMKQIRENSSTDDDSRELQELFDSISGKVVKAISSTNQDADSETEDWPVQQDKVFKQVGHMMRQMHDSLGALGYDKFVENAVQAIPDAKDRLTYIANLTEQAACKVLNATDVATPLQEELEAGADILGAKWDALYENKLSVEEFKLLADETRAYLKNAIPQRTAQTKAQLMEIMMAQDFQDLTGQVIKKVVSLAQDLETQLMSILVETIPEEKRTPSVKTLLNGPVINGEGRSDVVVSQRQVDDLLDSLGF